MAPAMESGMWDHPATTANLDLLRQRGVHMVGPEPGRLASGGYGQGRMSEPEVILDAARWVLGRMGPLAGRSVVVTAGGTREAIDPVRFIGNRSSGRMGYALAFAARDRGAGVTLIHGPTALTPPHGVADVAVESAEQMKNAVLESTAAADALVMAAAVADYQPSSTARQKIKKQREGLRLDLVRTADILSTVADRRGRSGHPRVVIGFAAETQDLIANAREKLASKALDLIVANDVSAADSGFDTEANRVTLLDAGGGIEAHPLMPKAAVAEVIIDRLASLLSP
jgi:phosphopantothenoylcysteine decarboxylase/phosphopantothenate--cysteine ligase